jgi:hypothetical protein
MIVLGINDGHDSGVCLLQDGRVRRILLPKSTFHAASCPSQASAAAWWTSAFSS